MYWIIFIALTFIWGSSFILMKHALLVFSPVQLACMRIAIAGIVLLPVLLFQINKIEKRQWKYLLAIGLIGSFLPAFCFTNAQLHLPSNQAGMLNSLTPFFTFLTAWLVFKEKFVSIKFFGVCVGLAGALLLSLTKVQGHIQLNGWAWLIVLATFFYGFNANIILRYVKGLNPLLLNAGALSLVTIPSVSILLQTNIINVLQTNPDAPQALTYVFILAIFGTGVASYLYFLLIQKKGTLFGVMVTYFMPFVAILWGIIDHETITVYQALAFVLVLVAMWMVNYKKIKINNTTD